MRESNGVEVPPSSLDDRRSELQRFLQQRSKDFFPSEELCGEVETAVPVHRRLAYGSLDFVKTPMQLLITVHLLTFYQQVGVRLSTLAFFTATARCIDVLSDPFMASLSDGFSSRFGRRRPFILGGVLLYGPCLFALCSPPAGISSGLWFGTFYILFFLTDTITNVPHNALGQEVTSNADQRRQLFMVAKIFEAFGMICAAVLPVAFTTLLSPVCSLPDECRDVENNPSCVKLRLECDATESGRGVRFVGLTFAAYALIAGVLCVGFVVERRTARASRATSLLHDEETQGAPTKLDEVLPSFISLMKNKPFRAMVLPWILDRTIVAMLSSLLPFFVQYVIAPEEVCLQSVPPTPETSFQCSSQNMLGVGLVALLLCAVASMPLWQLLAWKFGDYRTWIAFNFLNAATNILFIFGRSSQRSIYLTIGFAALNGLPLGASFLTDNILGLVIDYDELRTGTRTEAAFTMFASFIPKLVSVPAAAFPLSVLACIGFDEPVDGQIQEQDSKTKTAILLMFSVVPTLLALVSCALKAAHFPFKDLRRADAEIKAALPLRLAGEPYRDPLTGAFRRQALLPPSISAHRRAMALLDHFTGVKIIEKIRIQGCVVLARKSCRQLALAIGTTLLLAGSTVASMALGLLGDRRMNWMPSLLVLLMGVGVLVTLIAGLRLRAALALQQLLPAAPEALLEDACTRRQDLARNDIAPEALEKIEAWTEEMVGAGGSGLSVSEAFGTASSARDVPIPAENS